jgi:electron transport complex protein RnfC
MAITIESTTDSDADVKSALGKQTRLEGKEKASSSEAKVSDEKPVEEKVASGAAEGEVTEKSTEPGKAEKEPSSNLDKRFAKLTRQRKEAEARAADAERQRAYWENEAKKSKPPEKSETKVETKPTISDGEPKQESFEKYQDYIDAKLEWKLQRLEAERERKASEKATKDAAENIWKSYADKEKAFMKEHPDMQERIDAMKEAGIRMSPIVEDRIITTGPELAYELMKDPDEFKALCAMTPNDALEHIGVIKAQLRATAAAKPGSEKEKVVVETKQPKPVSPVGSRATVIKDPEKMSIKEYDKWRREGNSPSA